jgi:hypothetical protein
MDPGGPCFYHLAHIFCLFCCCWDHRVHSHRNTQLVSWRISSPLILTVGLQTVPSLPTLITTFSYNLRRIRRGLSARLSLSPRFCAPGKGTPPTYELGSPYKNSTSLIFPAASAPTFLHSTPSYYNFQNTGIFNITQLFLETISRTWYSAHRNNPASRAAITPLSSNARWPPAMTWASSIRRSMAYPTYLRSPQ